MIRSELLDYFNHIDIKAAPTVATEDMGLEYEFATSDGAGTVLGAMGNWPFHKFPPLEQRKWQEIRAAIRTGTLDTEMLEGTGLESLIESLYTIQQVDPNKMMKDLLNLPEYLDQPYYCLFDTGVFYHETENPVFFMDYTQAKSAFKNTYCTDFTPWEKMGDDELLFWYEKLHNDLQDLAITDYTNPNEESCS